MGVYIKGITLCEQCRNKLKCKKKRIDKVEAMDYESAKCKKYSHKDYRERSERNKYSCSDIIP